MANNEQIDGTSYYELPCGKYLEDFIAFKRLSFAWGSALKYLWRAGSKDSESYDKDMRKCGHYCRFLENLCGIPEGGALNVVYGLADEARKWGMADITADPADEAEDRDRFSRWFNERINNDVDLDTINAPGPSELRKDW